MASELKSILQLPRDFTYLSQRDWWLLTQRLEDKRHDFNLMHTHSLPIYHAIIKLKESTMKQKFHFKSLSPLQRVYW